MSSNLSELNRYIHLTRSYILYMDEVLMSRAPAIDRELARVIRVQLIPVLRLLRDEQRRLILKGHKNLFVSQR
ncbi:hypothetical protein ACWXWB_14835 [Pantoea dispersa]|uniref:hypothetical protein n=1 Tax=Pantoea dispersa TaxID=59814 RepID=UPI002DBA4192|nr:hypothetical protein [Pantoea dispersa]MEB5973219.1 hypothetical protein [Pantoea dispersa]